MGDWFIGEIRLFAAPPTQIPRGWTACNGQILPVNQNQALFALLGNRYGGDGRTTFALPDLRGRVPYGFGVGPNGTVPLATQGGAEFVTLTTANLPTHVHSVGCLNDNATGAALPNAVPATSTKPSQAPTSAPPAPTLFGPGNGTTQAMAANSVQTTGGSQPHENRQPFLAMTYCIATQGIFPSRQ